MGITKKPVKYAVIDAFTDSEFKGNPAAVCLLEEQKPIEWLQSVAAEFNISETCYLTALPVSDSPIPRFHLRWFTPVTEESRSFWSNILCSTFGFSYTSLKTWLRFSFLKSNMVVLFSGLLFVTDLSVCIPWRLLSKNRNLLQ